MTRKPGEMPAGAATATGAGRAGRGLTLIELMIALAICVVLLGLSVPSMSSWLSRNRLKAVASDLVADLGEARFEAARTGRPMYVVFQVGDDWCYAVARSASADCRRPDAQVLKVVSGKTRPGVSLPEAAPMLFDPAQPAELTANGHGRLATQRGDVVDVRVSRLGRPILCAPDAPLPGVAGCR
jgi:type IV fimbrial biogenesis protein FimT